MVRKTTSLKIDEQLWKEIKIHCITVGKEISEYIEELARENLKKQRKT